MGSSDDASEQPLQTPWTFWYDRTAVTSTADPYCKTLQQLGTVETVQSFWRYYCNLTRPGQLQPGDNFHLFRDKRPPAVESLPNGCCWVYRLHHGGVDEESEANRLWERLLLSLVGETIGEPSVIGAIVCVREEETVFSVWCSETAGADIRSRVERQLKQSMFEGGQETDSPGPELQWKAIAPWTAGRKQIVAPHAQPLPQHLSHIEERLVAAEARAAAAEARAAAVEMELRELRGLAGRPAAALSNNHGH